jgi:hypothetical protein
MFARWAAEHGWSPAWLSAASGLDSAAEPLGLAADPAPVSAAPAAQTAPEIAAPAVASPELQQLTAITVTLIEVRRTVEQLAAGQERMASDIKKLQAVDEEIRLKISAAPLRPAAAPASKPTPTLRAPTPLR